ncbi:class I SAM-dependent methyltransferase [Dokdonia sp. Hel_I_53]|uniref:class I SAM-dependent methyltransferase n=1 Tax=Dokdonia sp. Hel_I_53 TaxID=1566287 RepID=UPI00119C7F8A|nr:class I SAM-dependent methyltransferase [Dokdonia sp. Hel_I_53]TVZ51654.1 methyltransferase family protein [Dokdonia sp. Hel_I_53]
MGKETDIFGAALTDYWGGTHVEDIVVHSSIADDDEIPIPYLFRTFEEMPAIEQKALQLCKGKVLDVGSGAGSHSLWLQDNNFDVTGIDISEGAVTLSRKRGLLKTIHSSILEHTKTYDTLLLLMNGTGIFEKINKVDVYLKHLKSLLEPDGQILIDGSDIAYMFEDEDGGFWLDTHRDYYGEVTYKMSYGGNQGPSFDWLYLDYARLAWYAEKNGLRCNLVLEGDHYDYLARLTSL